MEVLRFGVAGLSRAFVMMLPTFQQHPRARLVAAADPRPEARAGFGAEFGGRTYETVEEMCCDPNVDVVYVASPHQFHEENACMAPACCKHVLVEKPMALTLASCRAMIDATRRAGVHLVVGPSHSFDAPIALARRLIASGDYGRQRLISHLTYTDFLYRPRRPEELDTAQGGGVVFSQAAHQVDIVRLLAGAPVSTVQASTFAWDPARKTEGAYTALRRFADGAAATLTYSGYAHFDSDEFCDWIGETGRLRSPDEYGAARRALQAAGKKGELGLKIARAYSERGVATARPEANPPFHEHFGLVLVSCDHADLRPTPRGVVIYSDTERRMVNLRPPKVPRGEVVDELYQAVINERRPVHSGSWGMATLQVCLAILQSAAESRPVDLSSKKVD